jgi:hypothetical protein
MALFAAAAAAGVLLPPAARATRSERRRSAANRLLAGGLLVGMIFVSNRAALYHHTRARDEASRRVIAALERYRDEQHAYPERLAQLVPTYIPEIPRPRIGLIDHEGENFRYTNFGDSFALEFTSILWMLCAYSPRYPFERDTMSTPAGRWTCEENPPPLW